MTTKTVRLNVKTIKRIQNMGKMGDTFDSMINKCVDSYIEENKLN